MSGFGFDEYTGFENMDSNYAEEIGGIQYDNTSYGINNFSPVGEQLMHNTYGNAWNNGAGIYTPQNQFNFDNQQLLSLGFTQAEINTLLYIINCCGKVTPASLSQWGLPYEDCKKLKYMYDIITGRVIVESTDDLVKHLRRMFGKHRRVGLGDLKTTTVSVLPRRCIVAGIPERFPYAVYNSKNYCGMAMTYEVTDIANKRILVRTKRKPQLKYGSSKKLIMVEDLDNKTVKFVDDEKQLTKTEKESPNYLVSSAVEIRRIGADGTVEVAFNKKIARMCNRFIVVASLKRPEFYLWMYEIIAIEGTKIYVYAKTASSGENVKYNGGTMRVYDFGFNGAEIKNKTLRAATEVYNKICGVYATEEPGNCDFEAIEAPRKVNNIQPTEINSEDDEWY